MGKSLFEVFGVTSPVSDPTKIPVDAVCPIGTHAEVQPDPAFVFAYQTLRRLLRAIKKTVPLWIWGPSGCGKTELVVQTAARLNRPCHVIPFGEETSVRELMGCFRLEGGQTKFVYGRLTSAIMTPGAVVVLDEFPQAPPGIAGQLNRFLETKQLVIQETGEIVKAAADVVVIATANTAGGQDETGLYAGNHPQNAATRNRFTSGLRVAYPTPAEEVKILQAKHPLADTVLGAPTPEKSFTGSVAQLAADIRDLVESGAVSHVFSIRTSLAFVESTLDFTDVREGFSSAYYDLLADSERPVVAEVFHRTFKVRLEG